MSCVFKIVKSTNYELSKNQNDSCLFDNEFEIGYGIRVLKL